jgi:glycosyltransferase involved in cell wall biosynthesis
MRVLVVLPYVPWPLNRGTYQRVFHLTRELARRNTVDLFCLDAESAGPAHASVFEAFCRRFYAQPFVHPPWPRLFPERLLNPIPTTIQHWESPSARAALRRFTAGQEYDLVQFCDLVLWPYVRDLPTPAPRVMDRSRVDLLFQREELARLKLDARERMLRRENLWKLKRYERAASAALAATIVCGPDDEVFMRKNVSKRAPLFVLANGCDAEFFSQALFPPQPDDAPTLLFCGAMDYSPNVDGIRWYFEAVDPLVRERMPQRRILIVGRDPKPEVRSLGSIPGVEVTGGVPDVRPYYQRSWGQIVPLRIGGGTRLKIVESLCIGCPVVSTTIGAQGLELASEEHLLLADKPAAFADAVLRLLGDAGLRSRLRVAGTERVLARYTWPALGGLLDSYLKSIATPRP